MDQKVFIVGATGVFGSRLVEQLLACGVKPTLAGRNQVSLDAFNRSHGTALETCVFDRNVPDTQMLRNLRGSILVDAAGPFQNSQLTLIEACIANGANYVDLADARDFIAKVPDLDRSAKSAGVVVISGASSTPALSHAVLDQLTKGWKSIHGIFVGITPGNRAPRGESVVRAILSGVGWPFLVFQNGMWREVKGWSGNERRHLPGLGRRNFVHNETPDHDLLLQRFAPKAHAVFKAGLELGVMHNALRVMAMTPLPWNKLAIPILQLAKLLKPFGTDRGGMIVEATGRDAEDKPIKSIWTLRAEQGLGPNVPALPALALLLKFKTLKRGARAAAGELEIKEISEHLTRLGITTTTTTHIFQGANVFQQALPEDQWRALPAANKAVHICQPGIVLKGEATIKGAETLLGRAVALAFGFPKAAKQAPVTVVIDSDGRREVWTRSFGNHVMRSRMSMAKRNASCVEERFGPFAFRMRLRAGNYGLDMLMDGLRLGPLPLPR